VFKVFMRWVSSLFRTCFSPEMKNKGTLYRSHWKKVGLVPFSTDVNSGRQQWTYYTHTTMNGLAGGYIVIHCSACPLLTSVIVDKMKGVKSVSRTHTSDEGKFKFKW